MDKLIYVTYTDAGVLDGGFEQIPPIDHQSRMIVVDQATAAAWVDYRANEARDGVELAPPPAAPALTEADYIAFMQRALDTKAAERKYDSIMSLCTYATSTNPKFAAEGQSGVEWRDAMWAFGYDMLAQVESGAHAAPTLDELAAMLPTMEWPA